jgi:putative endonuclease
MAINTRQKGDVGENVACRYLVNKGYVVLERNYRKKWGEIDIITTKDKIIHFIEVKSVMVKNLYDFDSHRPEDNVNSLKISHIRRMVQTYFNEKTLSYDNGFAFHVICVYLNSVTRKAKVNMIENIIL